MPIYTSSWNWQRQQVVYTCMCMHMSVCVSRRSGWNFVRVCVHLYAFGLHECWHVCTPADARTSAHDTEKTDYINDLESFFSLTLCWLTWHTGTLFLFFVAQLGGSGDIASRSIVLLTPSVWKHIKGGRERGGGGWEKESHRRLSRHICMPDRPNHVKFDRHFMNFLQKTRAACKQNRKFVQNVMMWQTIALRMQQEEKVPRAFAKGAVANYRHIFSNERCSFELNPLPPRPNKHIMFQSISPADALPCARVTAGRRRDHEISSIAMLDRDRSATCPTSSSCSVKKCRFFQTNKLLPSPPPLPNEHRSFETKCRQMATAPNPLLKLHQLHLSDWQGSLTHNTCHAQSFQPIYYMYPICLKTLQTS